MGYFDTTEFPQIEILAGTTTSSATYTGYLDMTYMGQQLIGQGGTPQGTAYTPNTSQL